MGIRWVPANTSSVIFQFGRPTGRILSPGLNFYVPLIQSTHDVSHRISVMPLKGAFFSSDHVAISMVGALHYQFLPSKSTEVLTMLDDPEKQVRSYVYSMVRDVASKMPLDEIMSGQAAIAAEVEKNLHGELERFGVAITDIQIAELMPSADVRASMDRVIESRRLLEAARNKAEAERITLIAAAQADAERMRLRGEGIASERTAILARLEQDVETMAKHLQMTPSMLMEYILRMQTMDVYQGLAASENAKIIFMPSSPSEFTKALITANEVK